MDSDSFAPFPGTSHSAVLEQKASRRVRHKISTLIYVTLDQGNGGIICDLSEFGIAVQAVAMLRLHQHVHLRFDLPPNRTRIDVVGHVVWSNSSGRAGIQFTQISHRTRRQLKDWLFTNLLATAAYVSEASGIFSPDKQADLDRLVFSPKLRLMSAGQPQRQDADITREDPPPQSPRDDKEVQPDSLTDVWLEFSWWPVPIAARTLSSAVDATVLLMSLLLFCLIFLAISHQIPPWPVTIASCAGALIIFSVLYRYLFVIHGAGTPGFRLALIAAPDADADVRSEQELARFR
jgi:PilZ domain